MTEAEEVREEVEEPQSSRRSRSAQESDEGFEDEGDVYMYVEDVEESLQDLGDYNRFLEESGFVTEQHLKEITHELGLIKLCWQDVPDVHFDDRRHYPLSYLQNSKKEKLLLWYAENFRQQINYRYPNRRPLLLACDNECGVQKMVCTTIRPTNMKYPEFNTWQGCANFVAEYLRFEELQSPTLLPDRISSPQTVLKRQAGHCFEYATLLTSFLIGSGYDAYVVSGYASREICRRDQTRVECPFLQDEPEPEEPEEPQEDRKYSLKSPIELKSQFLEEMENREIQKQIDAQRAQELSELEAIRKFEKPPPDELCQQKPLSLPAQRSLHKSDVGNLSPLGARLDPGQQPDEFENKITYILNRLKERLVAFQAWRLHSWVVILRSKDVKEPIFVESTTGIAKKVEDPAYHGIESIWNHLNYWVLVQFPYKTETCRDISFHLNNSYNWEKLLIAEPINSRIMPKKLLEADVEELSKAYIEVEKHLDMPYSWVDILELSHAAYERRFAQAKRVIHYRKAVSEQFAPYSQTDGLVERVTRYDDYECRQLREIRERFAHRYDRMYFSQMTIADGSVLEKFERGREDGLKERFYYSMNTGVESKFTFLFYPQGRFDGLYEWDMDPLYMTMHFENRPDFKYYTHVEFAERISQDQPLRHITKITQKYHRNPEKPADEDVAMVEYCLEEKKIILKYHYGEEHVTQADRIFLKPNLAERGVRLAFDPALTYGYLTGPNTPDPKLLQLYRLEVEYFSKEEQEEKRTREREDELLCLLRLRAQELAAPRLVISEFDVERNTDAKQAAEERVREKAERAEKEMQMVCDFLAPYYAKLGLKPKTELPISKANEVIQECLQDWKDLLVARANEIQQQFEQSCQDFQERNNWYEQNQRSITKEQEEEYFDYCKRNSYFLHILEVRLNRHKEMAPQRFREIQSYLRNDPRLGAAYTRRKHHF